MAGPGAGFLLDENLKLRFYKSYFTENGLCKNITAIGKEWIPTLTKYENNAETKQNEKKKRGAGVLILLIVFLILFLVTTALMGSWMYDLATRDKYTVDLDMGAPVGEIELFCIEYENELGEITVRGLNADNVVAPGTTVNYDLRLRNNDDMVIDFVMTPTVEFLTGDPVPVAFRILDDYGNYILGDDDYWVTGEDMNALAHKGSVHPSEVYTYHISWKWLFEVDDNQDTYDTYLGNQDGEVVPGVRVGIETEASANPHVTTKDITHVTHLRGENFGCCWCCWLVWLLVLVCLILTIRIWRMRKRLDEQKDTLEKYEKLLNAHGIIVNQ